MECHPHGARRTRRRTTLAVLSVAAASALAPAAADAARGSPVALLQLRDSGGLERFAQAVSDPASPRYRGYLTVRQLARRFGATPRAKATTVRWLRSHGLAASVAPSGTFVLARGSAGAIRGAFAAGSGASAAASAGDRLPVPPELRGVVAEAQLLGGGASASAAARRGARRPARARRPRNIPQYDPDDPYRGLPASSGSVLPRTGTPRGCEAGIQRGFAPNQVHSAYGIDALHRRGLRGEGMRVAVIEIDGFRRGDIEAYADCFGARLPQIRTRTIGQRGNATDGIETPLDLEVLVTAAPRLERIDVVTANPANENLSSALVQAVTAALTARGKPVHAISMSLGLCEATYGLLDVGGPLTAVHALNDLFALAAGSGVSVLVSAGDTGSAGCARSTQTATPLAEFPTTSPWVTSVGGTNLALTPQNRIEAEVVWNNTPHEVNLVRQLGLTNVKPSDVSSAGGGGRSLLFARPWYQRAPGLSGTPRVVPDIAALADPSPGYAYYCTTEACAQELQLHGWGTVGGTSAAAPLMTAASLLMSQDAMRRGQPPLGFLNPLIYQLANGSQRAKLFNDVTIGSNDVSAAMPASSLADGLPLGVFPAVPGYDHASGWGSPKLAAFNRAALLVGQGADN